MLQSVIGWAVKCDICQREVTLLRKSCHFSRKDVIKALNDNEWIVIGKEAICKSCHDNIKKEAQDRENHCSETD